MPKYEILHCDDCQKKPRFISIQAKSTKDFIVKHFYCKNCDLTYYEFIFIKKMDIKNESLECAISD